MKLRAFAAAWTVFSALAAPTLLLAQAPPEQPAPHEPPAAEPAPESDPPAEAKPKPEPVKPAPEDESGPPPQASQPSAPAPQAEPAPQPAAPAAEQPPARPAPVARVAASASVTIKDYSFSPSSVTVNAGDTVTWTNAGPTEHTATGSGFDTGLLDKGESGSHTFNEAGTFSYICTPHPYMKASVTVVGGDSGTDGSDSGSGAAAGQDDGGSGSTSESTGDSADEASLPNSGAESWALALIGTGLLALGVSLRGRTN